MNERRALVVLDGCDHVLDDAAAVAAALRDRCPRTSVLVTSRERLGIADERLMDLPTLPDEAAIALFFDRASAVRDDFDPTIHADAVRSLIGRLDGLPLAIELAAARVRTHQPTEIDRLLGEHVRVLRGPGRRTAAGHDLEAAIAWSYELLEPTEQRVFEHLGVFASPCTAGDVADRLPDLEVDSCTDLLDGLVERSLVTLAPPRDSDRTSRYRLLSTLRAFARMRLDDRPDRDAIWARHRDHVVSAVRSAAGRLCGPDEERWVQELADRWEDLRAVVQRALADGDVATVTQVTSALVHHSTMRGREVGDWADAALTLEGFWDEEGATLAAGLVAEARIRAADFDGAADLAEAVIAHAGPDAPETWLSHSSLAMSVLARGRIGEGLAHQAQTRKTAEAHAAVDPLAPAVASYMALTVMVYGGQVDEALRIGERCNELARATGCPSIEAMALLGEGRALVSRDPARARILLQRSLELSTGVTNAVLAAQARWALVEIATTDDPTGALRVLRDLLHELQTPLDEAHGQQTLLRTIVPLLAAGADQPALLATAALDVPAWDSTVLHRVAKQRVLERVDAGAWAAAVGRAAELGLAGVRFEITAVIDTLLD